MKLTKARLKQIIKEELEGSGETDVIDDFLSAPVGEESPELTEGQMELWLTLQNAEMIATLAVMAATVGITGLRVLGDMLYRFLRKRNLNARNAAVEAHKKARKQRSEAELILLTEFLLDDDAFIAALDGLVTSGSRKDVIAFNKNVRAKIKELGDMVRTSPEELLKRLRKKADAGEIEQRVVSDFEEKVSSADPEYDAEALRKAEPASSAPRQRQKIKESIKETNKMKLTKAKLKRMIKEELTRTLKESASSKDEWLKILNSLELEPDTPIEKYADELADNEVTISDFDSGLQGLGNELIWTDLLKLGISKRNAQEIEQFMHIAAEWDPYRYLAEVEDEETPEEKERRLCADDLKAAKEILKRRIGGYSGTALPGGKRIK